MNDYRPPRRRSKAELDALAAGTDDGSELAEILGELRDAGESVAPTTPNRMLTEFVSTPGRPSEAVPSTPRKKPMLTTLVATVGTTAGKLVLAGSAAAAVVTGAVVTDSIPFDQQPNIEVIAAGTSDSSSTTVGGTTSTTEATQSTQTTQANDSGSSGSTNTSTTTDDRSNGPVADSPAQVIQVLDGGSITVAVQDGVPVLIDTQTNEGWSVGDDGSTFGNIDLAFRRGNERIDVDVEVEDGAIRVRIKDRRTDSETETGLDGNPFPDPDSSDSDSSDSDSSDSSGNSDDDDDDSSGSDSDSDDSDSDDDDDDSDDTDNSDSGSDDDDDDDDSDNSGSGSGSDDD